MLRALWWVEKRGLEQVVLCTDSVSALMALGGTEGGRARVDIVGEILMLVTKLERKAILLCLCGYLHMWG